MEIIEKYFILFMLYSFLGWCMETILVSLSSKKIVNRGFLIGPYCPIYGCGSIIIIHFLGKFSEYPIALFVLIIAICGLLEYFTSWIMETIFKARWWDYSNKKFNLNGRVCLENLTEFGVLGLIVTYILNPFFMTNIIENMKINQIQLISMVLFIIFALDNMVSFIVVFGFRKVTKQVNQEGKADNTEQITKMVREKFSQKSFLHKRFIDAYPRLEAIQIKLKQLRSKIEVVTNDARDAMVEKKDEIKQNIEKNTRKAKIKVYLGKKHIKSNFKGRNFNDEKGK